MERADLVEYGVAVTVAIDLSCFLAHGCGLGVAFCWRNGQIWC